MTGPNGNGPAPGAAGSDENAPGGVEGDWIERPLGDPERFNALVIGRLLARVEGDRVRVRMIPRSMHANPYGAIHGGATLGLIDTGMFAILNVASGGRITQVVTLEVSTQFLAPGRPDRPLDIVGEMVSETGRMVFVRGFTEQADDDGTIVRTAAFQGTMRKIKAG